MTVSLERRDNTLHIHGSIEFANANACSDEGLVLLAAMQGDVVVDLAAATAVSSLSVAVLLRWARAVAANGAVLRLKNVSEKARAIVRVSGLTDALPEFI